MRTRTLWMATAVITIAGATNGQQVRGQRTTGAGAKALSPRLFIDETTGRIRGAAPGCAGALIAFDVDIDGDQDLVVAQDGDLGIWINAGRGTFEDQAGQRIGGVTGDVSALGAADIDGDGDLDFVTGGDLPNGVADRLWINRGGNQNGTTGNFVRDNSFPNGLLRDGLTTSVVFGDVDGDGDPDLLLTRGQSAHGLGSGDVNELLINQGLFSGQFVADAAFSAGSWHNGAELFSTDGAVFGDFDGDTHLDILLLNSDVAANQGPPGEPNQLLLNGGTGTFTDATSQIVPNWSDNSFDAEALDIDADGDLDLVIANSVLSISTAQSGDVLINQGGLQGGAEGNFLDDPTSFLEPSSLSDGIRLSIAAADLDADGDPEAMTTVHDLPGGGNHRLWINQGGRQGGALGEMQELDGFDPYDSVSSGLVFVDIDGDRDLDIVQTHCGSAGGANVPSFLTVYRNTRR